jgi:cytochrome d ubiquinol oxidase subunit I
MVENFDLSLVDWSRAQFALTALYHWIFVPLTLGITFIIAIMETLYVRSGDEKWKLITKFWMKLFGINFAIGVATGIILEFQFGTNWSNYSWFVGDIFGAPLAIEGMMAFFMESTFVAVMFFGWEKVSKKMHLTASWLTAVGACLSALWILVANAWMQNPVGMEFNPDTARNEMVDFWAVLTNPVAINKVTHTVTSGFTLAAVFVVGISCWFLLKGKQKDLALKSIRVASIFGFFGAVLVGATGDGSAKMVAEHQPMKLAAMEGLQKGSEEQGLILIGGMKQTDGGYMVSDPWVEIPYLLSFLSFGEMDAFVAGIDDVLDGNEKYGYLSAEEKMIKGRFAIEQLKAYKAAQKADDELESQRLRALFQDDEFLSEYFAYFGYGYFTDKNDLVPNVPLTFFSFRLMVGAGTWFILMFALTFWFTRKGQDQLSDKKWMLHAGLWSILLAYAASMSGWIVAEVGRQPWVIQDLMPTKVAVTNISTGAVQTTFFIFVALFTVMLIAEVRIMLTQIKKQKDLEA